MRVLVKRWRETIVKIYCFLDDGAGVKFKFHKAFPSSEFVRNSLTQSGFVVNQEKSLLPYRKYDLAQNKFIF